MTSPLLLKQIPFLRIVLSFALGIILQWYVPIDVVWLCCAVISCFILYTCFRLLPAKTRFRHRWVEGVTLLSLMLACGCLIVHVHDVRDNRNWFGHSNDINPLAVVLQEPLVAKPRSWKAEAAVIAVADSARQWKNSTGKLIVYFKKDSALPYRLGYGNIIYIKKPAQPIRNSGNPGTFNYRQYCAFSNIYHQVYVTDADITITGKQQTNWLKQRLFEWRGKLLLLLRQNIRGSNETAIAEALLIGYRYDLDKDLMQAYSNTGVIHIIAISGLHLAMIYGLLLFLFGKLTTSKMGKVLFSLIALSILWTFTLLAGAVPSVLRAAIMFSCLLLGGLLQRRSNIFNNLASSAFIMLALDPFALWDDGFQLSYAAVAGIVLLHRYVNSWFVFSNKIMVNIWNLCSITISAQVFTLPFIIYHFHQAPTLFLVANLVAVPLSAVVLYAEIALVLLSKTFLAKFLGIFISYFLSLLNHFVEYISEASFTVIGNIYLHVWETILLLLVISYCCTWLILKQSKYLTYAVVLGCFLSIAHAGLILSSYQQKKIIVYAVPKHTAIDILHNGSYTFIGDSALATDLKLSNLHLKPTRLAAYSLNCNKNIYPNASLMIKGKMATILVLSKPLPVVDIGALNKIIITGNPGVSIAEIHKAAPNATIIADANNTNYRLSQWKKEADSLNLQFHSVADEGAYIISL